MFKSLLALVAVATCCLSALAAPPDDFSKPIDLKMQAPPEASPWSASFYWDVRGGKANAVVMNKLRDLTINGHPTKFHLDGFAGTTVDREASAVAGLSINRTWGWFDQVYVGLGVGVSISGGNPIGGGVLATVGIRF